MVLFPQSQRADIVLQKKILLVSNGNNHCPCSWCYFQKLLECCFCWRPEDTLVCTNSTRLTPQTWAVPCLVVLHFKPISQWPLVLKAGETVLCTCQGKRKLDWVKQVKENHGIFSALSLQWREQDVVELVALCCCLCVRKNTRCVRGKCGYKHSDLGCAFGWFSTWYVVRARCIWTVNVAFWRQIHPGRWSCAVRCHLSKLLAPPALPQSLNIRQDFSFLQLYLMKVWCFAWWLHAFHVFCQV